jgi:hypothetical protein
MMRAKKELQKSFERRLNMKIKSVLATMSFVFLFGLAAQAVTIYSPPATGVELNDFIYCVAYNVGTDDVQVTGKLVSLNNSQDPYPVMNEGTDILPPGRENILAYDNSQALVRCEFTFPKNARIRAYIMVNHGPVTVLSEEAR